MSVFGEMLKDGESIIRNDGVDLDFDYQPKVILYREAEQRQIIAAIRPLFRKMNGRNLLVYGKPGIGKTAAARHVLEAMGEEDTSGLEEVVPCYVNCWRANTSYKIAVDLCEQLGYRFTQNKKTEELFRIIANMVNKSSTAFVFDEIDKAEDNDFLYTLLEAIYRRSVVLITNHKDWILSLDSRIKSRLLPDAVEFRPYSAIETQGILRDRAAKAFAPGTLGDPELSQISKKACEEGDIRVGLHLLRQSAINAEARSSRRIEAEDVEKALGSLDSVSIKNSEELEDESRFVLGIVKANSAKKIGELFRAYSEAGGKASYKTFQRKIAKLADNGFVNVRKITGGPEGSTTIVNHLRTKRITDY